MAKKILQWLMVGVAFMVLTGCHDPDPVPDNNNSTQQGTDKPTQNKKTITGYVIDDPVVGATIEVYDANGTLLTKEENATDGSGKFSVSVDKDKIDSSYLKLKAYREDKDGVLLAYLNIDNDEVYITQYTTALINYLMLKGKSSATEYFDLATKVGLENGEITETSDYLGQTIKYIASNVEKAFKSGDVYLAFSDDTLTPKGKSLSAGSIVDFSVNGYKSLVCQNNPYVKIENSILKVEDDLNATTTINCIAKDDNKTDFFSINLIADNSKSFKISANEKIATYQGIEIVKPSNDEIEIKKSNDASIVLKKDGKVISAQGLLKFYPDGKVLKEPLTVKIPSLDLNKSFYLLSKDGSIEKIDATYKNGYYIAKIPHFSLLADEIKIDPTITKSEDNSNLSINYENLLEYIKKKDAPYYIEKADISYPNVLLAYNYEESDLKENLNDSIKSLLALLVLKNGKGLIDFDGTKINFNNGNISFDVSSSKENEQSKKQSDEAIFGSF